MTKASDNAFPSILITEGTEPSAPAAGKQRLYIDSTTHHLMRTNSSGTETDLEASSGASAFSSYTPALTAATTNPTLGSGSSATGRYIQIGKLVFVSGSFVFGSSGVNAGSGEYRISLPVTSASTIILSGTTVLFDNSATLFSIAASYYSSTTVMRIAIPTTALVVTHSSPWTWAANDQIVFSAIYEAP